MSLQPQATQRQRLPVDPGRADTLCAMRSVVAGVDRHGDPLRSLAPMSCRGILQHETDHLRGVLFIDRLTGQRRKDALAQIS